MFLSTIVIMSASIAISEPTQAAEDVLHIDPLLIVQAEEVWSYIASDDNALWPGWNAASTPILFYLPGVQDLLINHPDPPEGFMVYDGPVRFSTSGGGATMHIRNGETHFDADGQNTSTDINGVRTLVVADTLSNRKPNTIGLLYDSRPPAEKAETLTYDTLRADPYDQTAMIAHEAFHVYQGLFSEGKHADESTVAMYPTLSIENNIGFALEAQWLTEALKAKSPAEVREAALNWLAVRTHRRALIPPEAVAYEDGNEFAEGLAKSMEYRLLVTLEDQSPGKMMHYAQGFLGYEDLQPQRDDLLKQMSQMMRGEINVNNDPYGTAPMRMRLYYSGMAIAALLDRLAPEGRADEWKQRIFESGTTLTSLALNMPKATPKELAQRYRHLASSNEYAALHETKTELREKGLIHIQEMVKEIKQGEGTLLVIDYSQLPDTKPRLGFTPFGVQRVDEQRAIYHMVTLAGRLRPETVFRQTKPSPMLHDRQAKLFMFRLPEIVTREMLQEKLGMMPKPNEPQIIESLELPGVSLNLGIVTLSEEPGTLVIRLLD